MQVCKINLNAEEYKKELETTIQQTKQSVNKLNNDLNKPSQATNNLDKSLKQTQTSAKNVGKGFRESMSSAASDTKKAGEAVGSIGSLFGLLPPKIAAIGTAIETCLLGPIGWVTAAIGALIAIGTAAFNALTESVEEFAQKAAASTERLQKQADEIKSIEDVTAGYIKQLNQLQSMEIDGNARKEATVNILQKLEARYGSLGAQIDNTTGKIKNFLEVQNKFQQLSSKNRIDSNSALIASKEREAMGSYIKTRTIDWFMTDGMSKREFEEFYRRQGAKKVKKYLVEKVNNSTDEDDLGYLETIKFLDEIIELQEKNNRLKKYGVETEEEVIQKFQQEQEAILNLEQQIAAAKAQLSRQQSDDAFNSSSDFNEKIKNRQTLLDEELEKYKKLELEYKKLQKSKNPDDEKALLELELAMQESLARQYDLEKSIRSVREQQQALQKQQAEAEAKKRQEFEKQTEELEKQKKLKAEELKKNFQDQYLSLYGKLNIDSPELENYSLQKALQSAEKTKGDKLSTAEENAVKKIFSLTESLEKLGRFKISPIEIKTNSLASRGGFMESIKVVGADRYNQQILKYNQQNHNILKQIHTGLNKLNQGL